MMHVSRETHTNLSRWRARKYIFTRFAQSALSKVYFGTLDTRPPLRKGRVRLFCKWIRRGYSDFSRPSSKRFREQRRRFESRMKRRGINERKKMFAEVEERSAEEFLNLPGLPVAPSFFFLFFFTRMLVKVYGSLCRDRAIYMRSIGFVEKSASSSYLQSQRQLLFAAKLGSFCIICE